MKHTEFELEQIIFQIILVQKKLMDQFSRVVHMNMTKITLFLYKAKSRFLTQKLANV